MKNDLNYFATALDSMVRKISSQGDFTTFDLHAKTGGYLTITDSITGNPLLISLISKINNGNDRKYFEFSQEKAQRLHNRKRKYSEKTSWESRDEEKMRFAGAFVFQNFIYSFSGFPELVDEAILFVAKLFIAPNKERLLLFQYIMDIYNSREHHEGLDIFNEIKDRWVVI